MASVFVDAWLRLDFINSAPPLQHWYKTPTGFQDHIIHPGGKDTCLIICRLLNKCNESGCVSIPVSLAFG